VKQVVVKSQSPLNQRGTSNASASVSAAVSSTQLTQLKSFMDQIESATVRQLLQKFPTTELAARSISSSEWTASIFVPKVDGDKTYVTIPKNIENFIDSLMLMSILKVFETKRWIPVLSSTELPKSVLETKEGAFFAGFVSASLRPETGELESGSTKYAKGIKAHQTYSVEKAYGKARHLRTGGLDKVTERLSSMKGFTSAWWGLRGTIVAIFKGLPASKVTHLESYVKSKNELLKTVKTRLQYENGGCYRPEELMYLGERYLDAKTALAGFLSQLDTPSEDLAKRFDQVYAPVKMKVDTADNEIKANLASRARILFPQGNNRKLQIWSKKTLSEKLLELSEEKLKEFRPETLPGVTASPTEVSLTEDLDKYISERYRNVPKTNTTKEVIQSWYSTFESPEGDEE